PRASFAHCAALATSTAPCASSNPPGLADCGAGTQPVVGATNYVHVRLNNPGPYGAGTASGVLKVYRTPAGGGTTWNNATNGDWVFIGQQALTVPAGVTVAKIPWTNIPGPGHFCLLARWVSATDPMTFAEGPNTALNTKNNNNIAWKNFQTIRGRVLEPVRSWFTLGNATGRDAKTDLVLTAEKPVRGTVVVDLGRELLERWRAGGGQSAGVKQVGETAFQFDPQRAASGGGMHVISFRSFRRAQGPGWPDTGVRPRQADGPGVPRVRSEKSNFRPPPVRQTEAARAKVGRWPTNPPNSATTG
ncbi:hypothetical protein K7G98_19930, partial [Saccharothrix sp. MB29]|nr:hypothetical protein [Saccharothrix sp. MB29]